MGEIERREYERSYWKAFNTYAYEIRKNEKHIKEWKQAGSKQYHTIGSFEFSENYPQLIRDAEDRIARLREQVLELDRQRDRYQKGIDYEEEY